MDTDMIAELTMPTDEAVGPPVDEYTKLVPMDSALVDLLPTTATYIATEVLRTTPAGILEDFSTFGLLFESLSVRDLRIYVQASDGEVYHYRDRNGLEADAIVHLKDGRWDAFEIKLESMRIEMAAEHLLKLKEPFFLAVLARTEFAYRRSDGVFIVPIGCLKDCTRVYAIFTSEKTQNSFPVLRKYCTGNWLIFHYGMGY